MAIHVYTFVAAARADRACPLKLLTHLNDSFTGLDASTWNVLDKTTFHCSYASDPGCTWASGETDDPLGMEPSIEGP